MVTLQMIRGHGIPVSNAANCRDISYSLVFMAAMFVYKEEGIVSCSWLSRRLFLLRLSKTIKRIAQISRMALSSSVHISIFSGSRSSSCIRRLA